MPLRHLAIRRRAVVLAATFLASASAYCPGAPRRIAIEAMASKLLIALWRLCLLVLISESRPPSRHSQKGSPLAASHRR